jgi:hypothetical protein
MAKIKESRASPLKLEDSSSILTVGGIRKVLEIVTEEGDTLDTIAEQCGISPKVLHEANIIRLGKKYPTELASGIKLYYSCSMGSRKGVHLYT